MRRVCECVSASVVGAMMVGVVSGEGHSEPPFVIRDSSGRVRVACDESGDQFALTFLDSEGRAQIGLLTSASKGPVISCISGNGSRYGIRMGQEDADTWAVRIDQEEGQAVLRCDAKGSAGLVLGDQGGRHVLMRSDGASQALVMGQRGVGLIKLDAQERGSLVSVGDGFGAGLIVRRDEKAMLWLGEDARGESSDAAGVRIGCERGKMAMMRLTGGSGSPKVELQDSVTGGGGVQVGGGEKFGLIKVGIKTDGRPAARIESASGTKLWEVVEDE